MKGRPKITVTMTHVLSMDRGAHGPVSVLVALVYPTHVGLNPALDPVPTRWLILEEEIAQEGILTL